MVGTHRAVAGSKGSPRDWRDLSAAPRLARLRRRGSARSSCRTRRGRPDVHADHAARPVHRQGTGAAAADRSADHAPLPEVERVFGKIGRADTATDPAPLTMIETLIQLKPRDQWRPGMTTRDIIDELDATVRPARRHQRLGHADQDPHRHARHRHQDPGRGSRSPGRTWPRSSASASESSGVMHDVEGTTSAYSERVAGGRYIEIRARTALAAARSASISTTSTRSSPRPSAAST
jgi:hypothetical protein